MRRESNVDMKVTFLYLSKSSSRSYICLIDSGSVIAVEIGEANVIHLEKGEGS